MQYLMLVALETGASISHATHSALAWSERHPEATLFEERPYAEWHHTRPADDSV
jgi:hypothetical protein